MDSRSRRISRVVWTVLSLNTVVTVSKGVTGVLFGSLAMTADALHSLMDMSSNLIAIVGVRWGSQPADDDHPYGHTKFQSLAALGIAVMLGISCYEVLHSAIYRLVHPTPVHPPGLVPFLVMGFTLAINLGVSMYESRMSSELGSLILQADAQHTRADVLTTVSVLASLTASQAGLAWADAAVAVLVALFLAWIALGLVKLISQVLLDGAAVESEEVRGIVTAVPGVEDCHRIRSRRGEGGLWMDLHVLVDPDMTTRHAHEIAEEVERRLRARYGTEADVVVHIEPFGYDTDEEAVGTAASSRLHVAQPK
ncbi:MAG: cation diffusion facilitator family transporter [Candidatus Xenobia bacterium]